MGGDEYKQLEALKERSLLKCECPPRIVTVLTSWPDPAPHRPSGASSAQPWPQSQSCPSPVGKEGHIDELGKHFLPSKTFTPDSQTHPIDYLSVIQYPQPPIHCPVQPTM